MKIILNGKSRKLDSDQKVNDLIGLLKIDSKFIAVAVNGEFISKRDYSKIFLHDGDVVEVVSPHPGG